MAAIVTIPADIPGLLTHCSPVIHVKEGWGGIVYDASGNGTEPVHVGGSSWGMGKGMGHRLARSELALDLSLPTGRAHAAWWAWSRSPPEHEDPVQWGDLLRGCAAGKGNPERLQKGCLALAGRAVDPAPTTPDDDDDDG